MSHATFTEQSPGVFLLGGVLDFVSGPALREQGAKHIAAAPVDACVIDCATVEKSSSVGLSLLLAFMRDAEHAGKSLSVRGLPDDMREIASVSGLLDILPLAN